jgi:hypothetical protein
MTAAAARARVSRTRHAFDMTLPTVTEITLQLEPVAHDPFIDDADDGARPGTPVQQCLAPRAPGRETRPR